MRSKLARRVTVSLLLLAAAGACSRQPATRPYGSVEILLTGTDAAGVPQRLYGEFTFSSVDNGVVGSASTQTAGATGVLEVQLPAFRLGLRESSDATGAGPVWLERLAT